MLLKFWAMTFSRYARKVKIFTGVARTFTLPWPPEFKFRAGPKDKLNSTVISQPAIYVASLAALEKLRQDEGEVIFLPCEHAKVQQCPQSHGFATSML